MIGDSEEVCGKELSGMYASNLKKHLEVHKEAFTNFQKEEEEKSTCNLMTK